MLKCAFLIPFDSQVTVHLNFSFLLQIRFFRLFSLPKSEDGSNLRRLISESFACRTRRPKNLNYCLFPPSFVHMFYVLCRGAFLIRELVKRDLESFWKLLLYLFRGRNVLETLLCGVGICLNF
jgi:hypothetical protein